MSRILKDLMSSNQPHEHSEFASEPRFNPLAGSDDQSTPKPWRTGLLILAYSLVISVIAWQGWQLANRAFAPPYPVDSAEVAERPVVLLDHTDTQALPTADPPETGADADAVEAPTERQLGPVSLPRGTADLPQPPLVEPSSTDAGTALSAQETALSAQETAQDVPEDAQREAPEIATTNAPERAIQTTQPDIASVSDAPSSGTGAQFSDTRRNRALNQAQALYQSGREDEALMQLAQWLREDDHTDVRQYYARLLLRAGRAEEARYIVRPNYNREELELRAYADFQVNAFRDSLRHYSALLDRADTIQSEWYLWLAICHDNLGETSQAVVFYQTFLDQNGNQPDSLVRHARERLAALSG